MANGIDISRVSWSINQTDAAKAEKIVNWLRQLMDLTAKRDEEYNSGFVQNITIMLMGRFEKWYFSIKSLEFIASKSKFFPVYKELCDYLNDWIEIEKHRRFEASVNQSYKNEQSYLSLETNVKAWIISFYNNSTKHWREEGEDQDPSFGQQDFRENRFKKMTFKFCPEAYKYLFPREWAEQNKTEEQKRIENQGTWVNDAGILHSIKEIETIPSPMLKAVNIKMLKDGVRKYAPEFIELVEEQYPRSHEEEKEGAIA